jgi:hypothetical protein
MYLRIEAVVIRRNILQNSVDKYRIGHFACRKSVSFVNSLATNACRHHVTLMARCAELDGARFSRGCGIHRSTVSNIEVGRYGGDSKTLGVIESTLRAAGVEFIDENGGGPGVRLRKPVSGKSRK